MLAKDAFAALISLSLSVGAKRVIPLLANQRRSLPPRFQNLRKRLNFKGISSRIDYMPNRFKDEDEMLKTDFHRVCRHACSL